MAYDIVLLPGDGIGPEVLAQARGCLEALDEAHGLGLAFEEVPCGGQHYLKHGQEWPEGSLERCREADAVLLGAIGWPEASLPDGNIAGHNVVFGLRFGLDLYANVRPCRLYEGVPHKVHGEFRQVWEPGKVDLVIVRENTEGLYGGPRGTLTRGGADEVAIDNNVITRKGARRVCEVAFELCERRDGCPEDGTSRVTCVDKANVLAGSRLFRGVFDEVADAHPDVERDYAYIDAFTQWLVRRPEWYDVCVTSNLLGDIATDLAAVLQGGMGMAASGNLGDGHAMFEPVHGSAPKHAGQDRANPTGAILSAQMMLEWLGRTRGDDAATGAAAALEAAVADVLRQGEVRTYDLGGDASTTEVGKAVAARVGPG